MEIIIPALVAALFTAAVFHAPVREAVTQAHLKRVAPERIRAAAALTDAELADLSDKDLARFFKAYSYVRTVYRGGVLSYDPAMKALYERFDAEDHSRKAAKAAAKQAAHDAEAAEARQELGL